MNDRQLQINWTIPKVLAAIVGVGWVMVQASVPLYWLIERGFSPKPRQFGWQMYTNMAGGDRFFLLRLTDPTRGQQEYLGAGNRQRY